MSERIEICGAIPEPTHWPMMPMKVHGTIPGRDEPVFRIVFASSVYNLVGGEFTDPETGAVEYVGYQARPAYSHIGDKWIMEKWVSAFEFTRQTEVEYRAQWEDPVTKLCLTGPYPRNGAYQWVWTFNKPEMIGAAGIVAALVNKAKYNSHSANAAALRDARAAEKKAKFAQSFDRMKDSSRAFGIRAANIGGRVKATKSRPELQDARKLGLPVRGARQLKPSVEQLEVAGY
jgi:hypothetical protein